MKEWLGIWLIALNFLACRSGLAQAKAGSPLQQKQVLQNLSSGQWNTFETLTGVLPFIVIEGDTYLNSHWNLGTVALVTGELLQGYYLKYDLESGELNVLARDRKIKVLSPELVDGFVWKDSTDHTMHRYSNALNYIHTNMTGFAEILCEGDRILFKDTKLGERPPTYSVSLDVGDKNARYIKVQYYRILKGSSYATIKNWRDIVAFEPDRKDEIRSFVGENKFQHEEDQFIAIIAHLNSLRNP